MIRCIHDITEHLEWIEDLCREEACTAPRYDRDRLLAEAGKENQLLLGSFDGQTLLGIFCLLILENESYIETIFLYTCEERACADLTEYLSDRYPGYESWFVFHPKNHAVRAFLSGKQAFFFAEQRDMEYRGSVQQDVPEIIPYCDAWREEYLRVHSRDGYWDGETVLENTDTIDSYLCIRDHRIAGYLDLDRHEKLCSVTDLLVLPEYRNQGIGALLLQKAVFAAGNCRLILNVDMDNAPANHLYEKMGFQEIPGHNSVTARLQL